MWDKGLFWLRRLHEKLWLRPFLMALLSITVIFSAKLVDGSHLFDWMPDIERSSLTDLLNILSSSMLMISTFAVGSMVSAFAAASNTATPRSVNLVIADNVSQNALSLFIGSFIYSLVALFVLKNSYFDQAGYFLLFLITVALLTLVIIMFLRWVDHIARLGRMGTTIDKVTQATEEALLRRSRAPYLCAVPTHKDDTHRYKVTSQKVGHIQHVDIAELNLIAEKQDLNIIVHSLPGRFVAPDRALLSLDQLPEEDVQTALRACFRIGPDRVFDYDPRFGLVVLSEIACRALSPAVNDPGTAIVILTRFVHLFHTLVTHEAPAREIAYLRVKICALSMEDCFADAFRPIMRDGAANLEVMIKLQKSFASLAALDHDALASAAKTFAREAHDRGRQKLEFDADQKDFEKAYEWLAPASTE